jgi:hypothetical protein
VSKTRTFSKDIFCRRGKHHQPICIQQLQESPGVRCLGRVWRCSSLSHRHVIDCTENETAVSRMKLATFIFCTFSLTFFSLLKCVHASVVKIGCFISLEQFRVNSKLECWAVVQGAWLAWPVATISMESMLGVCLRERQLLLHPTPFYLSSPSQSAMRGDGKKI